MFSKHTKNKDVHCNRVSIFFLSMSYNVSYLALIVLCFYSKLQWTRVDLKAVVGFGICTRHRFSLCILPLRHSSKLYWRALARRTAVPNDAVEHTTTLTNKKKVVGCRQWHFHPYVNFTNSFSEPELLSPLAPSICLLP